MRCRLLVSKQISRPKLTVVLFHLTAVLANRARLASALWPTTGTVLLGEGCELDQMNFGVFRVSPWMCAGTHFQYSQDLKQEVTVMYGLVLQYIG